MKVTRPKKPPQFEAAEERFFALKGKHSSGLLNDQEYETALGDLVIQDDSGQPWMIGANTGQWYRHDGKDWVMAEPPELAATPPQPPKGGIPRKRVAIGCGAVLVVVAVFGCALGFPWLLQSGYLPAETAARFGESTLSFSEIPSPSANETHVASLPSLSVDPAVAKYGTRISVAGSGWQPGEMVTLEYVLPNGDSISGGQATADGDGRLAFAEWAPAEGDPLGIYVVSATGMESGTIRNTFEVVEPETGKPVQSTPEVAEPSPAATESTPEAVESPTEATESTSTSPPQASRIAFVDYDQAGDLEIFVMDADGTNVSQLTHNDAYDMYPAWSPDGTKVAFSSDVDGDTSQIWVVNADGSGQRQLTTGTESNIDPDWSPDGKLIAFTSYRDGNANIYVMNMDGTDQRRLTDHSEFDDDATWAPDGSKISFMSSRHGKPEIFAMNADGSQVTQLTDSPRYEKTVSAWSPDGQRVAVDAWDSEAQGYQIFLMSPDGSDFEYLVDGRDPSWSPDGNHLVYDHFEVTTLDLTTMQEVELTSGKTFHGGGMDWSGP